MQLNPGTKTIERDLLEALAKAEAFPDEMKLDLGKLQFQRCSRTDKGVSAARQVVSIKIRPEKRVIELANQYLPPQIRIMGLRRATKTFNSKTACSSRTYEYLLPTYAFAPYAWTTLDYRIDDSTREKVGRLLKMYEKSHNYHNFTSGKKYEEDSAMRHIISFTCDAPFLASRSSQPQILNSTTQEKREEEREGEREGENGKELQTSAKTKTESSEVENDAAKCGDEQNVKMEDGNAVEKSDSGADCGHMGKEESKQSAKKVEFMTLKVKGQSFMIHQIRKMVGLVIAIVRGFAPETTLIEAFQKGKVDIPRAPALGLLLENVSLSYQLVHCQSIGR
ncbi:tRNA pseudouridine synthase A [Geodia barretti]|nr:tRNA pseudouridine synthase A [Geodia barretti]